MNDPALKKIPANPRLIYMGTPDFALYPLKALIDNKNDLKAEILAVITQPDRPKGRGKKIISPPVKSLALDHGLTVLQPENIAAPAFLDRIREMKPDLIIVVAFGQILKRDLLEIPGAGVINIHASLLPKYRGAAPIQCAILNNETETGLTIMKMGEGLDTGPILLQKNLSISNDETAGSLHDRLAEMSGNLLDSFLQKASNTMIPEIPQDDAIATYAPKIEKSMTLIDWNKPAEEISALIRAFDPAPGAYTLWDDKRIKLYSPLIKDQGLKDNRPGKISGTEEGCLFVQTGNGALAIGEIQYPGKKRIPVKDFLRGFKLPENAIFGEN